jgi:predicted RecB family nuclease
MDKKSQSLSILVVMPFAEEFGDVYEVGIKTACRDAGANCERVDEQTFLENIPERIHSEIEKADLIIADVSEPNPNVFYEVGYAHGVRKPVILIIRDIHKTPFDIGHYPHIVYGGKIRHLKTELEKKVRACADKPELLRSPGREPAVDSELELISKHITNYLKSNNYNKMSFDRIEKLMGYPEEQVRKLIKKWPDTFRHSLVKVKNSTERKPGIGFV